MVKTIKISDETHEMIRKKGKKGETYEDIIKRIFQKAKELEEEVKDFERQVDGGNFM